MTPRPRDIQRKPSLRWRLRRWILRKLNAWPPHHVRPAEPQTDWRRMRRLERLVLEDELKRLREEVTELRGTVEARPSRSAP